MSTASDRINRLATLNNAGRYLEIGVAEGFTFHNVNVRHKTAVDPEFLFDTGRHSHKPGHYYFPMTSDSFFADMERIRADVYGEDVAWDIIYIDGLHRYEQAMKDFTNSLDFAHGNTIWIFDDTVPSDPWSAIPDMQFSYLLRQMAGLAGRDWHGDVFKCVFALHDFFPEFSYATVTGMGNPQTVVWHTGETARRPRIFRDIADIGRMGYFDMLGRCAALNPMPEGDMLSFVGKKFDSPRRDGSAFLPLLVRPVRTA